MAARLVLGLTQRVQRNAADESALPQQSRFLSLNPRRPGPRRPCRGSFLQADSVHQAKRWSLITLGVGDHERQSDARVSMRSTNSSYTNGRPRWVINPYCKQKVCWDFVMALLIIYSVLVVPYRIGFGKEITGAAIIFDIGVDVLFFADILLTFRTGFYDEHEVFVTDACSIARRYMRGFFMLDFLSVVPFDYLLGASMEGTGGSAAQGKLFKMLRLVRLMKLMRLFKLRRLTAMLEDLTNLSVESLGMIKAVGVVTFLIHMLSCIAFWISWSQCGDDCNMNDSDRPYSTWVHMWHVDLFRSVSQYIAAFHFVTATIMAVGYGDIFPANATERLYSAAVQLLGALAFGFILSAVNLVIESNSSQAKEDEKRKAEVKEWLSSREIPSHLRKRLWKRFTFYMSHRVTKDEFVMWSLPTNLRNAIVEQTRSTPVRILRESLGLEHPTLATELAISLLSSQVSCGETVLEAGEPPTEVYFIRSGRIEALLDEENLADLEELMASHKGGEPSVVSPTSPAPSRPDLQTGYSATSNGSGGGLFTEKLSDTFCKRWTSQSKPLMRKKSVEREGLTGSGRCSTNVFKSADSVLCAMYSEGESFGHFPVNPVTLQGCDKQTEIFSIFKDTLSRNLLQFPGAYERYEQMQAQARTILWQSVTSPEYAGGPRFADRRLKSRIVWRGELKSADSFPIDIFFVRKVVKVEPEEQRDPAFPTRRPAGKEWMGQHGTGSNCGSAPISGSSRLHAPQRHGGRQPPINAVTAAATAAALANGAAEVAGSAARDGGLANAGGVNSMRDERGVSRGTSSVSIGSPPDGRRCIPVDQGDDDRPSNFARARFMSARSVSLIPGTQEDPESVISGHETEKEVLDRWIVPPTNAYKVNWDVLIGIFILYSAASIPYHVGFVVEPGSAMAAFDALSDLLFSVDIILNFRTAFYDQDGVLNTIPSDISWRYVTGWFPVDFMSTFPIDWILRIWMPDAPGNSRAIRLLKIARLTRLLKLLRFMRLGKVLNLVNEAFAIPRLVVQIVYIFVRVFFMAHVIGCFWFFLTTLDWFDESCASGQLGCVKGAPSTSWIEALGSDADVGNRWSKYVVSLYWVFTTMTTVGYGDIFPMNDAERIYAMVVMILGATVFGYIIGSVAELSSSKNKEVDTDLNILREYCEERRLGERLQTLVRRQYEFWYKEMAPGATEAFLLSTLSPALRKEVIIYIHRQIIDSISLFRRQLPDWLKATLVRMLDPQAFGASELIIAPGELRKHQDFFFLHEGYVEMHSSDSWHAGKHFLVGDQDGDNSCGFARPRLVPLMTFAPGTTFGFEALLQSQPVDAAFRCHEESPCFIYVLRQGVLADTHQLQPDLGNIIQEVLVDTMMREAKRRKRILEAQAPQQAQGGHAARLPGALPTCAHMPGTLDSAGEGEDSHPLGVPPMLEAGSHGDADPVGASPSRRSSAGLTWEFRDTLSLPAPRHDLMSSQRSTNSWAAEVAAAAARAAASTDSFTSGESDLFSPGLRFTGFHPDTSLRGLSRSPRVDADVPREPKYSLGATTDSSGDFSDSAMQDLQSPRSHVQEQQRQLQRQQQQKSQQQQHRHHQAQLTPLQSGRGVPRLPNTAVEAPRPPEVLQDDGHDVPEEQTGSARHSRTSPFPKSKAQRPANPPPPALSPLAGPGVHWALLPPDDSAAFKFHCAVDNMATAGIEKRGSGGKALLC